MATVYYNIVFNANGGTGSVPSSMSGSAEGGSSVALPSSPHPSKTNFNFMGWSTNSGATSGGYSLTLPASGSGTIARTMYAAWKRKSITIGYDSNGGSESAKYQNAEAGVAFNLLSFVPTRTGHTFKGWNTNSSATTALYQPSQSVTRTADTRLYAVWEKITYTIKYNGNGNTGGTVPADQTKEYGTNLTLSSSVPTRTNYNFLGWSTSNTATTATYTAGGTYTANAGATLYAVWQLATRTYWLYYNANGGSGATESDVSPSTTASSYTFTVKSAQPTRAGYDFMGWSTSSSGLVEYNYPMSITVTDNTTLYAVWALKTYTVSYDANGGSGVPVNQTKQYGVNLTLSSTTPTRDGYTFQGWATSAGGAVAYSAGGTYTDNASITLYAVWQVITYTISYNANGGSGAPASQTKTFGVDIQLSGVVPTKSGYIFKGWDLAAIADTVFYRPLDVFNLNSDQTLYAVWVQATYKSADVFVDGDSCEVYVKAGGTIYGAELISI